MASPGHPRDGRASCYGQSSNHVLVPLATSDATDRAIVDFQAPSKLSVAQRRGAYEAHILIREFALTDASLANTCASAPLSGSDSSGYSSSGRRAIVVRVVGSVSKLTCRASTDENLIRNLPHRTTVSSSRSRDEMIPRA